jgi:hypothetical protein
MPITLRHMTLRTVLERHGIRTIREFTQRLRPDPEQPEPQGLSRQQCWNLWHGYAGVGKRTMQLLHARLGIPVDDLLRIKPVPHRERPRHTRRRQPPEGESNA